jgi:multicomponent Na+:H+ antiporter subunit D
MFAYSSVAQIGYITLGIALADLDGLTGAIAHLFNHGITKGALFLLAGCVALRAGGATFDCFAGLARRMPVTCFGMVIAGLSLIGVPATAGFTTKWYLVLGAIERGYWWVAAVILAGSLIAVVYVWRFVEVAYFRAPGPAAPREGEAPLSMLVPAWLLVAACVYFGIDTSFNIGYARSAAEFLAKPR